MKFSFCLLVLLLIASGLGYSQGCSDAGFCTIDGINPNHHIDTVISTNQQISLGTNYGIAQFGVRIMSPSIAYRFKATEHIAISFKLSYAVINGSLGSNQGLSDLFASFNYQLNEQFSVVNGIKTPFSMSNEKNKQRSMPHSYQTSLGTVDYLVGLSWKKNNWLVSLGSQIPLYQNANTFFIDEFSDDELNPNYASTNNYERKADVVFRLNYKVPMNNKNLGLTVGVLPIYHVANDTYIGSNKLRQEIEGSKGLTLNMSGIFRYSMNDYNNLEFTFGSPVLARTTRPDGLVQMAVNLQYNRSFGH